MLLRKRVKMIMRLLFLKISRRALCIILVPCLYKQLKIATLASLIQLCVRHKGDYCIPVLNLDTKRIRFIYASVSLPGACRLVSAWPFASHILGDRSLPFRLQGGHHTVQARRAVSATTDTQADPITFAAIQSRSIPLFLK